MEKAGPLDCCFSHQSVASSSLLMSVLTVDILSTFYGVFMDKCVNAASFFLNLGFDCLTVMFIAKM